MSAYPTTMAAAHSANIVNTAVGPNAARRLSRRAGRLLRTPTHRHTIHIARRKYLTTPNFPTAGRGRMTDSNRSKETTRRMNRPPTTSAQPIAFNRVVWTQETGEGVGAA